VRARRKGFEDEIAQSAPDSSDREIVLGPLGKRLGYLMRRAQLAIFEDFIASCSEYDIRPGQYSVLTLVEHNPGASQTQIAEAVGIKKTNFVALIDRLERRGLVQRKTMPNDRRSHALYLTDAGKTLMSNLHRTAARHERRLIERIGADMHGSMFAPLASIAAMTGPTSLDQPHKPKRK